MSRRARILCSRPSVRPSSAVLRLRSTIFFEDACAGPLCVVLLVPTCMRARACVLYMGPQPSGVQRSAVVPGGIRDDTSPMSLHRLGMSAAGYRGLLRIAGPLRDLYTCAPINDEPDCQIVI